MQALLDAPEYSRVYALTRRPLGREHPKLANRIVVFARMAEQLKGMTAQDAFCCIGTTIAEAGSEDAFRDADVDAVLQFAEAARAAGVTRFAVVSSVGADSNSKKFYLRTKGEMEEAVTRLGFPSLDILQPEPVARSAQTDRARSKPWERYSRRSSIHCSPGRANPGAPFRPRPWPGACSARHAAADAASIATPMRPSASWRS